MNEKEEIDEMQKQKGPDGQPLYFTRENLTQEYGEFEGERADHMQKLHSMFSQEQVSPAYSVFNWEGIFSLTS